MQTRFALAFSSLLALSLPVLGCAQIEADVDVTSAITPGSPADFANTVGDRVFFPTDSSELTADARLKLNQQAGWLHRYASYPFTIEGHGDERGTRDYNLALGARRAASVRAYLEARNIEPVRMRIISFGKERPISTCNQEACWSQNRRAVLVLRPVS